MKDEYSKEELRREEWDKAEKRVIEKGLEVGLESGAKNKALDIARNLLDVLDDTTIALKTGLTVEDVQQLH